MKCLTCCFCFVERKKRKQEVKLRNDSVFREYISEGYSIRQLAKQTAKDEEKIRRDIRSRLDENQIDCISEIFPDVHYLMIDGYALPKTEGSMRSEILLVYYDFIQDIVIWFSIRDGEKKEYITEDLLFLRDMMGYTEITACMSDGSPAII